jgi:hypothetical protein
MANNMKKIIMFITAVLIFSTAVFAQDKMSYQAKNYRSEVKTFLQEEGFSPYIDEDDGSLCFKKEGVFYYIYFESENPVFVEFHRENLGAEDADQAAVYKAVNDANSVKRCVKLMVSSKGNVAFTIEFFSTSAEEFKKTFYTNIKQFGYAKDYVMEKYADFKGDDNSSNGSLPFKITAVLVANTDYDGSVINDYGKNIYSSATQYIKPKLYIDTFTEGSYDIYVKFYTPDGLSTGSSSPSGYSYKQTLSLNKTSTIYYVSGWGNSTSGKWKAGSYRYEFYYKDKLVYTKYFNIL